MKTIIEDYRVRKSFTFGLHNEGEINTEKFQQLILTRALYCYVDENFNMYSLKDGKLKESKIDFHSNEYELEGTLKIDNDNFDDFENHYINHISGEKLFRNYFFSKDEDYHDEYIYFVFQPIVIELENKKEKNYSIFPVIKLINKESIIVDFSYYPSEESLSVEEFASNILRLEGQIKEVKLPYAYIDALNIEINKDNGERSTFDSNESVIITSENIKINNILELAEMFVSTIFNYEVATWFGRTLVSLDNTNLNSEQIELIKNGFKSPVQNPLYNTELIDFSEHPNTKFYVFGHFTITLGDILESYVPATVIDEEISILNTKMIVYSKVIDDQALDELLQSKKELHLLKQQITFKYSSILKLHKIMQYAVHDLFNINDKIDQIDALAQISFKQKEFIKTKKNNYFHFIISFVSIILSMSVVFDYIINPIYNHIYSSEMLPITQVYYYLGLIIISSIILYVLYKIITRVKKTK